jgi:FtsH-binding integral membrane protein
MGNIKLEVKTMADNNVKRERKTSLGGLIIRFIIAAIVLMVTAFFTPGYAIANFWTAILQAAVIVGLDYLIHAVTGMDASPFGRGISGFIVAALIIYVTQFVVPGVAVTIWGAIIAALVIGIIEAIFPVNVI